MHICTYLCMYSCTYVCIYIHIYMYECMYIYIIIYLRTYLKICPENRQSYSISRLQLWLDMPTNSKDLHSEKFLAEVIYTLDLESS